MNKGESAPQLELEFPAKPEYVRTARHAAAALARVQGLPENMIDDLKLVVSEACTQAVAASASTDDRGPVRLVVSEVGGEVAAEVLDHGLTRDRMRTSGPWSPTMPEVSPDVGLSLPLIRGLVDDLQVQPREGGGTRVRMVISREGNRG